MYTDRLHELLDIGGSYSPEAIVPVLHFVAIPYMQNALLVESLIP